MKATHLLRFLGAASCLTMASCALWPYANSDTSDRRGTGYSLDNPAPNGQSRYMAGADSTAAAPGAPADPNAIAGPASPADPNAPVPPTTPVPPATTTPAPGPVAPTAATTPPAPAAPAAPTYGTPVPGRRGFVYPPGVESKPENMVDVRDFTPGQKVRDPRTGKIFLVP